MMALSLLLCTLLAHAFEANQTLRLSSGGRTISVKNSSLTANDPVQIWTETNVNSQRWTLESGSNGLFYLKNVYGGYYLGVINSPGANAAVGQITKNATKALWDIVPVEGKANTYVVYLTTTHRFCLAAPATSSDGGAVTLLTASTAPAERIEWVVEETDAMPNYLDEKKRDEMMNGWRNHYYHAASTGHVIGKGGWWGDAEMFEIVLDAYETTGDRQYLTMFDELYKNFCKRNNTDWSGNNYNDDIAWMCIACIRAYLLTGTTDYRDKAKSNFDKMYARADAYGDGTLIWCMNWDGKGIQGTNSCVNGPSAVCACYLGLATGTESYFTKAKKIYTGERALLMEKNSDGSLTGKVWDSYDQKTKSYNYWASSYNQGTQLGAALMLYNHYGDEQYKKDADAIMTWTYNNMRDKTHNILTACQNVKGDLCLFKGILVRYVRRYAAEQNAPQYYTWLANSAYHAWNNRNSSGVTSNAWFEKTEENFVQGGEDFNNLGEGAFNCVSAAFNAHLGVVDHHEGFEKTEAEHFNFIQSAQISPCDEDESRMVGPMRNKYQTGYRMMKFGSKIATHITVRARMLRANTKLNFYIDQPNTSKGKLVCTISSTDFEGLNQWETVTKDLSLPIEGDHDIYMVCSGTANYDLADVNWFQFESRSQLYADLTKLSGNLTSSMIVSDLSACIDGKVTSDVKFSLSNVTDKWIQYESPMPVLLKAYSLWSGLMANTAPLSMKLQASNDGQTFVTLDEVGEIGYTACGQCVQRAITTTETYRFFRLIFPTTTSSTLLSLSEWQLIGTGISAYDITADGGTTTAGGEALTDHDVNTSVVTPVTATYASQGYYRLSAYSITGAKKDELLSWTLEGSENGSSWKTVDTQTDVVVPADNVTMGFALTVPASYNQYRIRFAGSSNIEVSEWQLFGLLDYGKFYADAAEICKTDVAYAPLSDNDGKTSSKLAGLQTIEYLSPIPLRMIGYALVPADDASLDPKDLVISGVNAAGTTSQVTMSALSFPIRGKRITKTVSSSTSFPTLQIQFNAQHTDQLASQLAEVEIYATAIAEEGSEVFVQPDMVSCNVEPASKSYAVDKVADQSRTTMCQVPFDNTVIFTMQYSEPQVFDAYSITAASSNAANDPMDWTLEGSTNGTSWTAIDSRSGEEFSNRYATQFYRTNQGDKAYTYYRLKVTAVNGGKQLQMAELQLLNLSKSPITAVSATKTDVREGSLRVDGGMVIVETPHATTVRFYDLQGRMLATEPVSSGASNVTLPAHDGVIVVVMQVNGKQLFLKVLK